MNRQAQAVSDEISTLANDARELLMATADVTGEKVEEARQRLTTALERSKEMYGRVRNKVVDKAKAADEAMHEHPYQAVAIGIGIGAVLGFFLAWRLTRD